jgi:2-desacetyl-2-hydroxyethyl bacteriochlorophyllide A dehydrogenase
MASEKLPDRMAAVVLEAPNHIKHECRLVPDTGPGEVLVRVRACALCGTDIHALRGLFKGVRLPVVLGHEFAGEVVALGEGVSGIPIGHRCCVENLIVCDECEFCRTGRPNLCTSLKSIGNTVDGAYAEYVAVPAACVVPMPDEVPFVVGSVMQTLATAYHAVRDVGGVRKGERVAIQGAGPIGLCALAVAKAEGAFVAISDTVEYRLEAARKMGADAVVNSLEKDFAARLDELTGGSGFDKVIEAVGGTQEITLAEACRIVKRNGTVVVMGVFAGDKIPIPAEDVRRLEIIIKGARGRYAGQFAECLELIAAGKIDIGPMLTHRVPLDRAVEGLEMMEDKQDGAIKVVLEPNGPSGG